MVELLGFLRPYDTVGSTTKVNSLFTDYEIREIR